MPWHGRRRQPRSSPMAAMGGARRPLASRRGPVLGGMIRGPQCERNTAPCAQRWHHTCGLSSPPRPTCVPQGASQPSWERGRRATLHSAWRAGPALSKTCGRWCRAGVCASRRKPGCRWRPRQRCGRYLTPDGHSWRRRRAVHAWGFFWILPLRENASPPFARNAVPLRAVVARVERMEGETRDTAGAFRHTNQWC